mmetsp:Transcript_41533/g.54680  ORF Transcript_41533/g.54680 Transcript_41533/m.54680 type:complete len:161 (-) Transcript_41533:140-622(-)
MRRKFAGKKHIVMYIDGACNGNPGPAASSACFFAVRNSLKLLSDNESDEEAGALSDRGYSSSDDDEILSDRRDQDPAEQDLEFLCNSSISIGFSTNNMAEYVGLVLGLVLSSFNKVDHIEIRTDSELMAKQVKGINTVRNVRLVYVMPIVHDLIKHFKSV